MTTAPMMAAMMLPGAVPAVVNQVRATQRPSTAPLFAATYFAVWLAVGLALEMLWPSHGYVAAGIVTVGAGLYEPGNPPELAVALARSERVRRFMRELVTP